MYKYLEQNLYLTVENLSTEENQDIKDDFIRENFWEEYVVNDLDSWLALFLARGGFQVHKT